MPKQLGVQSENEVHQYYHYVKKQIHLRICVPTPTNRRTRRSKALAIQFHPRDFGGVSFAFCLC